VRDLLSRVRFIAAYQSPMPMGSLPEDTSSAHTSLHSEYSVAMQADIDARYLCMHVLLVSAHAPDEFSCSYS